MTHDDTRKHREALKELGEFMEAMKTPSDAEIEAMREIGRRPGACGLDENGVLITVTMPSIRHTLTC